MMHPHTVKALAQSRELVDSASDMFERIERIRARRPSPSGRVIPEVDGMGRLTDMYIAPGTIAAAGSSHELVADIMSAIRESTTDAARQHYRAIQETTWPNIPLMPPVLRRRR